jgi:hypothetical protein
MQDELVSSVNRTPNAQDPATTTSVATSPAENKEPGGAVSMDQNTQRTTRTLPLKPTLKKPEDGKDDIPSLQEYQLALLRWEEKRLENEIQQRRNSISRDSFKSTMISFRKKGEPGTAEFNKLRKKKKISSTVKRQESKPEFVIDPKIKAPSYEPYNDPYLARYFSRPTPVRNLIRTGIVSQKS